MPTAPKTYHDQHFKHLTYLLLFICHTLPTLNPSHPAALPDAQHLPRAEPPQETERNEEKGPKTGVPPARRQGPSPPRPQPARALTPDAASRTQTELRTQHPRPRSTGSREGRDAPCRSRSPEQEGKNRRQQRTLETRRVL